MENNYIYSVTQLNNYSSTLLKSKLTNIWVKGEISSLKKYPSGYAYFTLKDNKSEISCITTIENFNNISDGIEVTINGDINIYAVKGNYQIRVHSMFPSGEGKLWIDYLALKNKLESQGIFNISSKNQLPSYPKNIGILTSLNGSVIKDIINIINRRAPYIKIIVRDTKVNGINAAKDLLNGLNEFREFNDVDLIIIARGGGSFEDLMGFNDESFIRGIYNCDIPIISAVGHETDFTLCDFVSDSRASTPSEAAEIACVDKNELLFQIDSMYNNIYRLIKHNVEKNRIIFSKFFNVITSSNNYNILSSKHQKINYLLSSLNASFKSRISKYKIQNNLYKKILSSVSIEKIKSMGFSIIKKDDLIITNINQLKINDFITIDIENGGIKSKVKRLYEKK